MAYLILNGVAVEIQSGSATRDREPVGELLVRTFGGTGKSTVRGYKRTWGPWETKPLTAAERTTLVNAIGLGVDIPASGAGMNPAAEGASVQVIATYTEQDHKDDAQPLGFQTILTLTLQEV